MVLLAALAQGCGDVDTDEVVDDGGTTSTGDAEAFAEIDGLIVRQALGAQAGVFAMDPRTGLMGPPYLTGTTEGAIRGVAGSPDGLHVAVQTTNSLTVAALDHSGELPGFIEVFKRRDLSVDTNPFIGFNRSGDWVISAGRVVSVPEGEVIDCDGERADYAWASPDGRHVFITCPLPRLAEFRVYRDGELALLFHSQMNVGPYWNGSGGGGTEISHDGDWVYAGGTSLHLPSLTMVSLPESGTLAATIPSPFEGDNARWPLGQHSGWRRGRLLRCRRSRHVDRRHDDGRTRRIARRLRGSGDCAPDRRARRSPRAPAGLGVKVGLLGFDEDESHAYYGGPVTEPVTNLDTGVCNDVPVGEYRIRRMPVAGGAPEDSAWPIDDVTSPLSETIPRDRGSRRSCSSRRPVIDSSPAADRAGPASSSSRTTCASSSGPRRFCRPDVGRPSRSISPRATSSRSGSRPYASSASMTPASGGATTTRSPSRSKSSTSGAAGLPPGAGGFAGPAIYATTHSAATAGTEVTLFGAGFGSSGTLNLGGSPLSRTDIVTWTDNRIVFRMPDDAPTEPAELTIDGGPDVYARTIYRETTNWTPTYDVPTHVAGPYGTVLIPISPSPPDDAEVTLVTGPENMGSGIGDPYTVTDEGIEIFLSNEAVQGDYRLSIQLGTETHQVIIGVDGSVGPVTEEWQRSDFGFGGIDDAVGFTMLEAGGYVAFAARNDPLVLLPSGLTVPLADGYESFAGEWVLGPFDPWVMRGDFSMTQLTGFEGSDTFVSGTYRYHAPLHEQLRAQIDAADFGYAYTVAPDAGFGLFGTVATNDACEFDLCATIWRFDPDHRHPRADHRGARVTYSFFGTGVPRRHAHVRRLQSVHLPLDDPTAVETVEFEQFFTPLATSWGYVAYNGQANRAATWIRANGGEFVDVGLDDVLSVGRSYDTTTALITTGSGEVFMLEESDPTTLVSLGAPDDWPYSIDTLTDNWITLTDSGLVVWITGSGTPYVYRRRLPE